MAAKSDFTFHCPPLPPIAPYLNHTLSQVLKKGGKKANPSGSGSNPFAARGEDVASAMYKYRQWNLDKNVELVARCQLDGAVRNPTTNRVAASTSINTAYIRPCTCDAHCV